MGQCLSVLSRHRRRSKVQPANEVKRNCGLRKGNTRRKMQSAEKIKENGEEPKLGVKENDDNCHPNKESDTEVNSVLSFSEESFTLDKLDVQDKTNIHEIEETKEDLVKGNEENGTDELNTMKKTKEDESAITFSGDCSVTNSNRMIVVRPAKEETSFGSHDTIANSSSVQHEPSLPNLSKVSRSLITPQTTCVYRYKTLVENCVGIVEEWDVEGLRCLTKQSGKDKKPLSRDEKMMRVAHLAVKKQPSFGGDVEVSKESHSLQSIENNNLGVDRLDTKQGMLTTDKAAVNPILIGKPEHETRVKMCAGQIENLKCSVNTNKLETSEACSCKEIMNNEHSENAPYWALQNIPSESWNKPICLTYKPDKGNVEREMKNIDSEMAALLKPDEPDEKKVKTTSIAFIIREGEKNRAQTPAGRAQQRLAMKQRTKVDQEKINEKQKSAARRRNENIAKRIQSARRRSIQKEIPADGQEQRTKTMERIEVVIARRDEILNQRVQTAHKSFQRKTDLMKIREKETNKVKEQLFEKVQGATARRDEIIHQRVQDAMKSCNQRKNPEEERQLEIHKTKERVFKKMEETTVRRNTILNQRIETVKKSSVSRCDVVKEREIVDAQEVDLKRKLTSSQHNRERILRKTIRRQVELEKGRELVRKRLARMKREQEEEYLQFVELETYEGENDDGENAW